MLYSNASTTTLETLLLEKKFTPIKRSEIGTSYLKTCKSDFRRQNGDVVSKKIKTMPLYKTTHLHLLDVEGPCIRGRTFWENAAIFPV